VGGVSWRYVVVAVMETLVLSLAFFFGFWVGMALIGVHLVVTR
jgi:hypothetical protein